MSIPIRFSRRLPGRWQRRFARLRPGSVLVLVIGLLVLMAVIATAFLTMSRFDRISTQEHTLNTQVDLLLDGVIGLVKGTVLDDLFVNGKFRPADPNYNQYTGVGMDQAARSWLLSTANQSTSVPNLGTAWLADRLPSVDNPALLARDPDNAPYWRYLSAPITAGPFESPYWPNGPAQPIVVSRNLTLALPGNPSGGGLNARWIPTTIQLGDGQWYPALQFMDYSTPPRLGPPVLAADTDGDGIADALLVKLPTGPVQGITYYAAVRIIDNGAAINASTATLPHDPPANLASSPYAGLLNLLYSKETLPRGAGDLFPSNVNLDGLLANGEAPNFQGDSIIPLLTWRMGTELPSGSRAAAYNKYLQPLLSNLKLVDDAGLPRANVPASAFDVLWMQLGRRLDNPGYLPSPLTPPRVSVVPYQALPISESMGLARRFILRDPSAFSAQNSSWLLDRLLPNSLYDNAPDSPYAPRDIYHWFNHNFWFRFPAGPGLGNSTPIRALTVVRNPVSGFAPSKYRYLNQDQPNIDPRSGFFTFGDMLTLGNRAYVYVGPEQGITYTPLHPAVPTPISPNPRAAFVAPRYCWVAEPWSTAPTKVSINTGTFGQLWTAFWSVMRDTTTPTGVPAGTDRRQFFSPLRDPSEQFFPNTGPGPTPLDGGKPRPEGRPMGSCIMPPSEVIKLRSALAAINTMGLREGSYNVPMRKIYLKALVPVVPGPVPSQALSISRFVEATVYGTEAQPYVAAVYAENDTAGVGTPGIDPPAGNPAAEGPKRGVGRNPHGYVGVELFNPYPFDIDLTHWNLGILEGRSTDPREAATAGGRSYLYPNMKLVSLYGSGGMTASANTGTLVVPSHGYLVLENYNDAMPTAGDAGHRPDKLNPLAPPADQTASRINYYYVPNLWQVMRDPDGGSSQPGGELVLLRPHQASLSDTTPPVLRSPTPGATVDYDDARVSDLVPVDSFDFHGMWLKDPAGSFHGINYFRSTAADGPKAWKFIYPGRWDPYLTIDNPPSNGALSNDPFGSYRHESTLKGDWSVGGTDGPFVRDVQPWGTSGARSCYPNDFPGIPLSNYGFPGPFAPLAPGPGNANGFGGSYPFGGFARNGDILAVPFIGAYRLRLLDADHPFDSQGQPRLAMDESVLLELNAVTMDCQQADDYDSQDGSDIHDDDTENIGRFYPIDGQDCPTPYPLPAVLPPAPINDFAPVPPALGWRYHWALQLFDYLTVESPRDAQLPAADPVAYPFAPVRGGLFPPQGVNHSSSSTPSPQSYGRVVGVLSGPGGATSGVDAYLSLNRTAPGAQAQVADAIGAEQDPVLFLTGPAAGMIARAGLVHPTSGRLLGNGGYPWTIQFSAGLPVRVNPGDAFVVLHGSASTEETAPINGLVNVNTASWRVLAAVPMVPDSAGANATLNSVLAWSIVYYRDIDDLSGPGFTRASPPHGHGPFRSLFELNDVPLRGPDGRAIMRQVPQPPPLRPLLLPLTFRDALHLKVGSCQSDVFTQAEGILTPIVGPSSAVPGDYEGTFLMMNRLSNLLSTRSDSFTAYVLVQGWRNAESKDAQLVVQRRATLLLDRSMVTPSNRSLSVIHVPTD